MICQRLEVLHGGGEVELVARAGEAAQKRSGIKVAKLVGLELVSQNAK